MAKIRTELSALEIRKIILDYFRRTYLPLKNKSDGIIVEMTGSKYDDCTAVAREVSSALNKRFEEIMANADYQIEGRDLELSELQEENKRLQERIDKLDATLTRKDILIKEVRDQLQVITSQVEQRKNKNECYQDKVTPTMTVEWIPGY